MRGVTTNLILYNCKLEFQLTRLMRGVTNHLHFQCRYLSISTHTPHARRDMKFQGTISFPKKFQLTRLMRGVTAHIVRAFILSAFQLTRLMRGVTRTETPTFCHIEHFNSHASCEA